VCQFFDKDVAMKSSRRINRQAWCVLVGLAVLCALAPACQCPPAGPRDPAAAASVDARASVPPTVYNVRAFGADGRRESKATAAIQRAIDAAHAAGGGAVFFPPGQYTSGAVTLKSHVTLDLDAGATIRASRDPADYPPPDTRYFASRFTLIGADGATGIALRGRGTIDGQAAFSYEEMKHHDPVSEREIELARQAGLPLKYYYRLPPHLSLVYLAGCRRVLVEGVRMIDSPGWTLTLTQCDDVALRNLTITNSLEKGTNCDGVDLDSCRNVTVSGCLIETGDDAICLKTISRGDAVGICENIVVSDCILASTSAALKLGTATRGEYRHVRFQNCVVRNTNRGMNIAVTDAVRVSDIVFSDVTVECNRKDFFWWGSGEAIAVVVSKGQLDPSGGGVDGLFFRNISGRCQGTSRIVGLPDGPPIKDVTLENVRLLMEAEGRPDKRVSDALRIDGVDRLALRRVEIAWDDRRPEPKWQSGLRISRIGRLELEGVTARQGLLDGASAAIELEGVAEGVIRHCRAAEGTTTFLRVAGAPPGDLWIYRNDFRRARTGLALPPDAPPSIRLEGNRP
jgi:hypothetical protein